MSKKNKEHVDSLCNPISIGDKVAVDEYDTLKSQDAFLSALKAAGVDNWLGYSMAQDILEEWQNE